MDNVTHTLFALTLARTPLARAGRGTDGRAGPGVERAGHRHRRPRSAARASYLTWHRGPTHGPLGILGLGLVVASLVLDRAPRPPAATGATSWTRRSACSSPIAMIGVLCHVLMDLPTSYGTRLLSPFDWHWFAVDWMPIVDVYLLFALAAGLLFGRSSAAGSGAGTPPSSSR